MIEADIRALTEQHLLGAVILQGNVPNNIRFVKPSDFSTPVSAKAWEVMLEHDRFDAVLVAGWLEEASVPVSFSIFTLVGSWLDDVPQVDLIETYAQRVKELAVVAKIERRKR